MAYSKQTWDTTSYVNPTRMNHIEDGIMDATPKYADKQYTGLSATTSDYYTKLANNVYTDLGIPSTSKILSVTLLGFSGVNNSPISLGIDRSALVWTHGNGHSFTNAIILLRVVYID